MLGRMTRWTWLASGTPSFLVTAGARVLAVGLMAATYVLIDDTNYLWFAAAAVLAGVTGFIAIASFDRLRRIHIASIPMVGSDGGPLTDKFGKAIYENVVIGEEADMRPDAKEALQSARKSKGGISLVQFMAGYGAQKVNDPGSIWDSTLLAGISSKLTGRLMLITLTAVMAVFWAAFAIQASGLAGERH